MSKILISDIHGCGKTLEKLINRISPSKTDELYVLGDVINKGPRSKRCIDILMELKSYMNFKLIRGNHEANFKQILDGKIELKQFLNFGGDATLRSFHVTHPKAIGRKYKEFLLDNKVIIKNQNSIFVHAGVDFSLDKPLEKNKSLYNIRNWYNEIKYKKLDNRIIYHGHSPITINQQKRLHERIFDQQYFNLDTGCVYPWKAGMGFLSAFFIEENKLIHEYNVEGK